VINTRIEKTKDNLVKKLGSVVKFTDMNHVKEIMYMEHLASDNIFPVTKIDKDRYLINATGEIKEYLHTESRKQNIDSLRKTFKKIRNIVNYNFTREKNELMFTLTYAENMTDTKRLYNDFRKFIMKIKYRYGKNTKIEYMSIVEPQGRGAWHCHVLLKFVDIEKIFIPNSEIAEFWGQGFTKVKSINVDGVDNIGAYLSAYLGDIEVTKDNVLEVFKHNGCNVKLGEVVEREVDGEKKKFIKGGRLHLYPTCMNIYRKSRGIKQPISEWITYDEAQKRIGQAIKPTYTSVIAIIGDDEKNVNTINYEFYNTKRQKGL
jgi:hypothetical protein